MHCLIEMKCLFGPSGDQLCKPAPVCFEIASSVDFLTSVIFIQFSCISVGNNSTRFYDCIYFQQFLLLFSSLSLNLDPFVSFVLCLVAYQKV